MTRKFIEDIPMHIDNCEPGQAPWTNTVFQTERLAVFEDAYPVTDGHLLIVPKYNDFEVVQEAFKEATRLGTDGVMTGAWDGFNIGINYGRSAGQTVAWPHVHMIPRRFGDMDDPAGGVRHVIPSRGNYRKKHVQD